MDAILESMRGRFGGRGVVGARYGWPIWTILGSAAVLICGPVITPTVAKGARVLCGPDAAVCGAVSNDGNTVVFNSLEVLANPENGAPHDPWATVYERSGGRTRLVSQPPSGYHWEGTPNLVAMSDDARHVFVMGAGHLTSEEHDFYEVYDFHDGAVDLITTGINDTFSPSIELLDGISADGTRAFFTSDERLAASDIDIYSDAVMRSGGVTTQISTGPYENVSRPDDPWTMFGEPDPDEQNHRHWAAFGGVSGDGSRAFFITRESLVTQDNDTSDDIYQRTALGTSLVTDFPLPPPFDEFPWWGGHRPLEWVGSSYDGSSVYFTSQDPVVEADHDMAPDVYIRDADGSYRLISTGPLDSCAGSFDDCYVWPLGASLDGSTAYFGTALGLVPGDVDGEDDIYANRAGVTYLVSTGPAEGPLVDWRIPDPTFVAASADGTRVVFETRQRLVPQDHDSSNDVYERIGSNTELVSVGPLGDSNEVDAQGVDISRDGRTVAFYTRERLLEDDTDDAGGDYYVRVEGSASNPGEARASSTTGPETKLVSIEAFPPKMTVGRIARKIGKKRARIKARCPATERSGPCRGRIRLTLRRNRLPLGSGGFRIRSGHTRSVLLRLTKRGRLVTRAGAGIRIHARLRGRDRFDNTQVLRRRVGLRSPAN